MPNTADYLNQLIDDRNDLADNLVTMGVAASHSETITELVPKVLDISGGGNIGYQVTFKVDGNDYYVAQCLQGESITEPPIPTSQTGTFTAWQLNGVDISFPYTPSADVELTAAFSEVHTEIEMYGMNESVCTGVTKVNDGFSVVGKFDYQYQQSFVFMVSNISAAAALLTPKQSTGTVTYNGETWYYSHTAAMTVTNEHAMYSGPFLGGPPACVEALLDYYFGVS